MSPIDCEAAGSKMRDRIALINMVHDPNIIFTCRLECIVQTGVVEASDFSKFLQNFNFYVVSWKIGPFKLF